MSIYVSNPNVQGTISFAGKDTWSGNLGPVLLPPVPSGTKLVLQLHATAALLPDLGTQGGTDIHLMGSVGIWEDNSNTLVAAQALSFVNERKPQTVPIALAGYYQTNAAGAKFHIRIWARDCTRVELHFDPNMPNGLCYGPGVFFALS
jgi:hypothetical protein